MQEFTVDEIQNYKMFYLLKTLDASSSNIVLSHKQTLMDVEVSPDDYSLFKVGEGSVLVAFRDVFQHVGKHNYVASNEYKEENILLNPYERIVDYYTTDKYDEPSGVFVFLDSCPAVLEGQDWRCDNALYGPRGFFPVGEPEGRLIEGANSIKVYEPILSINGIAHLIYFKHDGDDTDIRYKFTNDAELPQTAETLSEIIKLILEWSEVAGPPFENTEEIARKAKQFVEKFGITKSLVPDQPDMQVAKFLQGDTSARVRTAGTYPMSEELNNLITSSLPYMTFSKLVQLNPDLFNLEQAIAVERELCKEQWEHAMEKFRIKEPAVYGDVDSACNYLAEHLPNTAGFVRNYLTLLNKKKELLEEIG